MNAFDPELLRALADADAQSPPPGGTAITPHALLAAEARRTRRQLAAVAALMLLTLGAALAWPRPSVASRDDDRVQQDLAALRVDIVRLQAQLAALAPSLPAPSTHAADQIRYELAAARADAAIAALPAPRKENR